MYCTAVLVYILLFLLCCVVVACDILQVYDVTIAYCAWRVVENMAELDGAQLVRRLKRLYSSWKV